jgi:hypothetical protein
MLDLGIKRIGELAIVECKGRIVRSEAAFKLRKAILCLGDPRIIVLDLSKVSAIEGGGLGSRKARGIERIFIWEVDYLEKARIREGLPDIRKIHDSEIIGWLQEKANA